MLHALPQPYQCQPPQTVQREQLLAALRSLGTTMGRPPFVVETVLAQVQEHWKKEQR